MSCVIKRFPKTKICIGDLRSKIQLANREAVGQAPDDWDSSGVTFTTYATVWCAITTIGGRFLGVPRFSNTAIRESTTHLFYMRHRTDWRDIESGNTFVLMGDRRFRVLAVDNQDEDNIFDIIQCTERGESEAGQA